MPQQTEWDNRWQIGNTPWDIGSATPALIHWLRQHSARNKRILVPGSGTGHDAHLLAKHGAQVTAIDYAAGALKAAKDRYPASKVEWFLADVTQMAFVEPFDWVWEYTCFCALEPSQRQAYLNRVHAALKPGGLFLGLTFLRVPKADQGPPFATPPETFRGFLRAGFKLDAFEVPSVHSIKPRRGNEYWFVARKLD